MSDELLESDKLILKYRRRKNVILWSFRIIALAVMAIFIFLLGGYWAFLGIFLGVFGIGLLYALVIKWALHNFHNEIINAVLLESKFDLTYQKDFIYKSEDIESSKLINLQNLYYEATNKVSGKYYSHVFTSYDFQAYKFVKNRNMKKKEIIFNGRIYEIGEINYDFTCIIKEINKCNDILSQQDLNSFNTDNEDFNNQFIICTSDINKINFIIKNNSIEKILNLKEKYKGIISFSFTNNKVIFYINNGRSNFDVSNFKIKKDILNAFNKEYDCIKDVLDTFSIN